MQAVEILQDWQLPRNYEYITNNDISDVKNAASLAWIFGMNLCSTFVLVFKFVFLHQKMNYN